jgi:4,5-DOPA dioxygenase extradiol
MLPSLFVSHGAPTLTLDPSPARDFLGGLGAALPRPRAVLAVSAHWETPQPTLNRVDTNATIHDFYGFPEPLYRLRYPAPGSVDLARRAEELLRAAGFATGVDTERGLDHGAWVPLRLMYAAADVPVVQLSIQTALGPEHHVRLGQALAPLRAENVLVLGSGGFTHNLRSLDWSGIDAPEPSWTAEFSDWVHAALLEGRTADLLAYRTRAPHGARAHPSEDHFLPLFVALGAGGEGATRKRLHKSTTYGGLRMDAYAFGSA